MIIDAHTHRYPQKVIEDPAGFARRYGESKWLNMVCPINRKSLQGWASRERMISDMEKAGIDRCILLGWYWENSRTCLDANLWHREWIREDPDRFTAFLSLRPDVPRLDQYLRWAKEEGFHGIGESHPWAQGFSIRDKAWMKVMEFACDAGWPVNFHVTDPEGKDYPGKTPTPMEDFLWLANELPELKIILAHAGALYPIHNPAPENFYYDLAACPLLYSSSLYKKLISSAGVEKILWGSDYPLLLYPSKSKEPDFESFLSQFKHEADLAENDIRAILGVNVLNLLS